MWNVYREIDRKQTEDLLKVYMQIINQILLLKQKATRKNIFRLTICFSAWIPSYAIHICDIPNHTSASKFRIILRKNCFF